MSRLALNASSPGWVWVGQIRDGGVPISIVSEQAQEESSTILQDRRTFLGLGVSGAAALTAMMS